jgi:CheY-like chemotaxis protein
VSEAATGEEALDVLARTEPDVVLLDIRLPGISGVEVLRRMRRTARFDRVAVVMVSAHSSETIAEECGDLGCHAFIRKPFNNNDLLAVIGGAVPRNEDERPATD